MFISLLIMHTVMAIGLVNAGLMTFRQAIGVVLGANIGTTMTAFIVGIKIEEYALPIIAVGAFFLFFMNKKRFQYIGQVIFGFGALFLGLSTMGGGVKPLRELPAFTDFMVQLADQPVLGLIVGTVFTMIVQSSSATIGILQTVADEGMISLHGSLPILFGDNIGTTITTVLASIGASIAAKRTAMVHVIFNVCGAIIFMLLLPVVLWVVQWMGEGVNIRMQIAYAHGLFNVTNTLIFLPLIPVLAWIVTKAIPGKMEEIQFRPIYLDDRLLATPAVALGQAQHEILRMGQYARESLQDATKFFFNRDTKFADLALQKEGLINELNRKIIDYITRIHQNNGLPEGESEKASGWFQTVSDIERIGDHAENVVELAEFSIINKMEFSGAATKELQEMMEVADQTVEKALVALEDQNTEMARAVLELESKLDELEVVFRKNHIKRLNQNLCASGAGTIYLDLLTNLERIGDHCKNIAQFVLHEQH
ncbi:Na/Pi cotransporter family protein [Paenibacillus anaericanus]|nr:Na/Pi cotransporter family protein [Paenibacillus anaericanus]